MAVKFLVDDYITVYNGDCRNMSELPDESVHCVVCSPPYYLLRSYSGEQELVWGGKKDCNHSFNKKGFCAFCDTWKGELGLEPTPEMFISNLVAIFREVRRVLRKDGTCFINIGDTYFSGYASEGKKGFLKPRDLCLIPFHLAIELQKDGWWVRSDIIWPKSKAPEGRVDRPEKGHEYIFMLTKTGGIQFWVHRDRAGTRIEPAPDYRWVNQLSQEEAKEEPPGWKEEMAKCKHCEGKGKVKEHFLGEGEYSWLMCPLCRGTKKVKLWKRINLWRGRNIYWDASVVKDPYSRTEPKIKKGVPKHIRYGETNKELGRYDFLSQYSGVSEEGSNNISSVWRIPMEGFSGPHYAAFPRRLVALCVSICTPEAGCCSRCEAVYEKVNSEWRPTCDCNTGKRIPCMILDPFLGSGTTCLVARSLCRRAVGYDLSREYCEMAVKRLVGV